MSTTMYDYTQQRPAGWYTDPVSGGSMRWWDGAQWTADSDALFAAGHGVRPRPLPDSWNRHRRHTAGEIAMSTLGIALTSTAGALALGLVGITLFA